MDAGIDQLHHICALMDAAFTHDQLVGGNPFRQSHGNTQVGRKGLKISVIDTNQPRLRQSLQYDIEFAFVMGFDEHIQA